MEQNWIRAKFEKPKKFEYDEAATLRLLDRLIYSVTFESFLATKYNTTKRFGLEGLDSVIPGMKAMIDTAVELGGENSTALKACLQGVYNLDSGPANSFVY